MRLVNRKRFRLENPRIGHIKHYRWWATAQGCKRFLLWRILTKIKMKSYAAGNHISSSSNSCTYLLGQLVDLASVFLSWLRKRTRKLYVLKTFLFQRTRFVSRVKFFFSNIKNRFPKNAVQEFYVLARVHYLYYWTFLTTAVAEEKCRALLYRTSIWINVFAVWMTVWIQLNGLNRIELKTNLSALNKVLYFREQIFFLSTFKQSL